MKLTKKIEISPDEIADLIKKHLGDENAVIEFKTRIGSVKAGYGDEGNIYKDAALFEGVEVNTTEEI